MVNIEDLSGMAFQAENGGHTFEIGGIDDGGNTVALSGTVAGVFRRPDNADIAISGSASDGKVFITLPEDCYAVPGRFGLTVFVTSNSQKVCVYAAVGTVAQTSGGAVAGSTPQDVVDLVNAISAAVATIPASYTDLMAAIAPTYSNTALYAVGAYAWYNGSLYRCTTAITTAESWTAAHWTAAVLGNDVGELKSALSDNHFATPIGVAWKNNKRCNTDGTTIASPVTNNDWRVLIVPCSAGDIFTINAVSNNASSFRTWAFTDSNGTIISKRNVGDAVDELVVAPENAAYLYVNDKKSGGICYVGVYGGYGISTNYKTAIAIPENSDLNNYTTGGNYIVMTVAIMTTVQNAPTGLAGRLIVMTVNSGSIIDQVFISTNGTVYKRTGNLSRSTWDSWKKITTSESQYWYNKNIVIFGDSRTWYDGHNYTNNTKDELVGNECVGYQQTVKRLTGAKITSQGVSGETSAEICARIRAFDFTGYDAVLLEGGVNDWMQTESIGNIAPVGSTFDTTTMYGAWQSAIEYIQNNYPGIIIYMIVPAIGWINDTQFPYYYVEEKRRLADFYHLPCIDLYDKCGITILNRDYYYADDTTKTNGWRIHFNDEGNALIGYFIGEALNAASTDLISTERYFSLLGTDGLPVKSNTDLNDYNTYGNFFVASSDLAQTLENCPTTIGGRLTVMTFSGSQTTILQAYFSTAGSIYWRSYSSGSWKAWERVSKKSELDAIQQEYIATDHSSATTIPSESDLNDYTTPGNYKVSSSSIASSLTNCPSTLGGRLTVMTLTSDNAIIQTYINTSGNIFWRYGSLSSGKWKDWKKVADEYATDEDQLGTSGTENALHALMKQATYNIAFANAFQPIGMINYIGNTQNVHPKVLYFQNGFSGHKYWMAYTPYPNSNDRYENPCIAYSDDGFNWTNIEGNPLATNGNMVNIGGTDYAVSYNSDTHLVYRSDTSTLECWYRAVVESVKAEIIYRRTTTDGVTWTAAEALKIDTGHNITNLLSPCVNWNGSGYDVWVKGKESGSSKIDFYTVSSNGTTWTYVRSYDLTFDDDGLTVYPWHLDVIKDGTTYIMLVMCRNGTQIENNACSLFICTSSDNVTYSTPAKVVGGNSKGWDKYMYRSSIVHDADGYKIYYSAGSGGTTTIYNNAIWGIGITESDSLSDFIGAVY